MEGFWSGPENPEETRGRLHDAGGIAQDVGDEVALSFISRTGWVIGWLPSIMVGSLASLDPTS